MTTEQEPPKYTKEELDRMRQFEHMYQLKDLKAGEAITQRQVDAIEYFFSDVLEKIRAMKPTVSTVHFTKDGRPYTTDGNPFGMTVNGETPLDLKDGVKA